MTAAPTHETAFNPERADHETRRLVEKWAGRSGIETKPWVADQWTLTSNGNTSTVYMSAADLASSTPI